MRIKLKKVKITLNFQFETEDVDMLTLEERLIESFEYRIENGELIDTAKIKITDDEDLDPEFEDED